MNVDTIKQCVRGNASDRPFGNICTNTLCKKHYPNSTCTSAAAPACLTTDSEPIPSFFDEVDQLCEYTVTKGSSTWFCNTHQRVICHCDNTACGNTHGICK